MTTASGKVLALGNSYSAYFISSRHILHVTTLFGRPRKSSSVGVDSSVKGLWFSAHCIYSQRCSQLIPWKWWSFLPIIPLMFSAEAQRQPIFQPECGKTIPISFSRDQSGLAGRKLWTSKAMRKIVNETHTDQVTSWKFGEGCLNWIPALTQSAANQWCSSFPPLESQSRQRQPLPPGMFCDHWWGRVGTGSALALGESKPVVQVHFSIFWDSAKSLTLSQTREKCNSNLIPDKMEMLGAFLHFLRHKMYFHSSLPHGKLDMQWP